MSDRTYTLERYARVYDDKDGTYVQVGADSDGLDLVEIKLVEQNSEAYRGFTLQPPHAVFVARAILELYDAPPKAQERTP
jgi:uncharacterized protein YqjF (DUF2071 family)